MLTLEYSRSAGFILLHPCVHSKRVEVVFLVLLVPHYAEVRGNGDKTARIFNTGTLCSYSTPATGYSLAPVPVW
jgi:hypothetical protein